MKPSSPHCDACAIAVINNVVCHETGCPKAWESVSRECRWCGITFLPDEKHQDCCDELCDSLFHGKISPQGEVIELDGE